MSWPLTGKPLAEFNRLLSDWRQYSTVPFVGSDDTRRLFDVLTAAGLNPTLDDVGQRPHYWLAQLVSQVAGSGGSPGDLVFSGFTNGLGYLDIEGSAGVKTITITNTTEITYGAYCSDLPNLTSYVADSVVSISQSLFFASGCTRLANISFASLASVTSSIFIDGAAISTLSFPQLVSTGNFIMRHMTLDTIDLPLWFPANGTTIEFVDCGLTEAMVDARLANAVASAGFVSGALDLSGASNAAPSAAGLLDKATLEGRGVVVIVHP